MNPLATLILQTLQDTKSDVRNVSLEQQARIIAQKIKQGYVILPKHRDLDSQSKNSTNALNVVLIKFIRDLFAPQVREKYEELFKIGAIHTSQGAKELEERWLAFYNSKGHLAVLKTIARCMVCALTQNFAKPTQEVSELIQLLAYPQNLSDQEFLTRVYNALQTHKQSQVEQVLQYVDMMGSYMYDVCVAKITKQTAMDNPFKNLGNRELAALCEKWSMQICALEMPDMTPYKTLGGRESTQWNHNLKEFIGANDAVLCVIRVFNHQEIAKAFGQEGYARQVLVFKRIFLQYFESVNQHRDVFEPKDGVFYLLLEGDRGEIERCFEAFCAFLRQQVFSYKEHKQTLVFDGRLFDKKGDFLQILLELHAYIGEVV
ncbi:hypothetical protein [uncultured Helicobacter sp.]|uniref:hypothetical protein n=1 Tax=uncultured Helicobacter sp. TaxID=175537 RepID=UPI00374EA131